MDIKIFNACLAIGWLLILIGGVLVHVGLGLAVAGAVLILMSFLSVRIAGGVYQAAPDSAGGTD